MGSKTRLSSYCTERGDNTVNLVTSRKTIARLARPIIVWQHYEGSLWPTAGSHHRHDTAKNIENFILKEV